MSPRILIATILAVLLGIPLALRAESPAGPPGMRFVARPFGGDPLLGEGPGLMLPLMLRHAGLTPEQEQHVHEIMDADRERLHTLFGELEAANDALAAKLTAPGPLDAAALQPDVERVARLRRELMDQGLKTALAVRGVLTPEQLAKTAQVQGRLRTLQEEMRALLEGK
jgi:Spy/CpxP family protein refolding chaperone